MATETNNLKEKMSAQNKIAGYQSLIPIFETSNFTDAEYFVNSIEEIGSIADWSDNEKIVVLKSKVRGNSLKLISSSVELKNCETFEDFKTKFLNLFKTKASIVENQKDFENCKQMLDETVRMFSNRVTNITHKFLQIENSTIPEVNKILDQTKLVKFLDGLNPAIKRNVISKNPLNFDKAVEIAELESLNAKLFQEDNQSINAIRKTETDVKTQILIDNVLQNNSATQELIAALKESVDKLSLNKSTTEIPPPHPHPFQNVMFCQICGRSNHLTERCFYNTSASFYPPPQQFRSMRPHQPFTRPFFAPRQFSRPQNSVYPTSRPQYPAHPTSRGTYRNQTYRGRYPLYQSNNLNFRGGAF